MSNKIIYFTPRILSVLFILFLSLFALDVSSEYKGWSVVLPLLMHLLPQIILLICLIISWKYDLFGAIVFLFFAVFYIYQVGLERHWSWYVLISMPSLIISLLFLMSWKMKKKEILK